MEKRNRIRELRNNPTQAERALWQQLSARKVAGVRFNRQVDIDRLLRTSHRGR